MCYIQMTGYYVRRRLHMVGLSTTTVPWRPMRSMRDASDAVFRRTRSVIALVSPCFTVAQFSYKSQSLSRYNENVNRLRSFAPIIQNSIHSLNGAGSVVR